VRFKVDENMSTEVTECLHEAGHDALTIVEQGMAGVDDDRLAEVVQGEERVLVTLDLDFADIRRFQPGHHPGVVVFRVGQRHPERLVELLRRLLPELLLEFQPDELWIVKERGVRRRRT